MRRRGWESGPAPHDLETLIEQNQVQPVMGLCGVNAKYACAHAGRDLGVDCLCCLCIKPA
ncbi:hypothetical protein BOO71_0010843 [Deinococcus marmoris]|uniref:Uncharacterized protein n=1 Tax=Deinococcus marmoris TaxID=249408 RepID=A0A1U7NV33_9DEIO|nr:hypothetical protein BOO71_0010843 [Deinococcus marmoris]